MDENYIPPVEYETLSFQVRRDVEAQVRVPVNMTKEEAERLAERIRNSWFTTT